MLDTLVTHTSNIYSVLHVDRALATNSNGIGTHLTLNYSTYQKKLKYNLPRFILFSRCMVKKN